MLRIRSTLHVAARLGVRVNIALQQSARSPQQTGLWRNAIPFFVALDGGGPATTGQSAARRRAYLAGQNQVAMGASSAVDVIEGLVPVLGRPRMRST